MQEEGRSPGNTYKSGASKTHVDYSLVSIYERKFLQDIRILPYKEYFKSVSD